MAHSTPTAFLPEDNSTLRVLARDPLSPQNSNTCFPTSFQGAPRPEAAPDPGAHAGLASRPGGRERPPRCRMRVTGGASGMCPPVPRAAAMARRAAASSAPPHPRQLCKPRHPCPRQRPGFPCDTQPDVHLLLCSWLRSLSCSVTVPRSHVTDTAAARAHLCVRVCTCTRVCVCVCARTTFYLSPSRAAFPCLLRGTVAQSAQRRSSSRREPLPDPP